MTKNEYINRYGEEAYKEYLKKKKEHYEANKEEVLKKRKEHYEANKEELLKKKKEYRDSHKEEAKQYRDAHSEEAKKYQKEYYSTPKGRAVMLAKTYNHFDKEKGFDIANNVTHSYIIERIFSGKCIYCGDDNWEHLGCDRIDNTKGHTPDNVVPCCGICNAERSDKKTVEEMMEHRATNPRMLRNLNAQIEKTPSGAIKKRVFAVIG